MLRGKTMECITLVGLAVGSEKFLPDAMVQNKFLIHCSGFTIYVRNRLLKFPHYEDIKLYEETLLPLQLGIFI